MHLLIPVMGQVEVVMSNCLNVVTFHYFWKMQSDVWGFVSIQKHISHYSQGDFSVNSITINGWLRNLLWSEASQVIQSYALSSILVVEHTGKN